MTTFAPAVKEERHDEAEIAELAAKMVEAHKTQAAKQATQQVSNQVLLGSQTQQTPGSILNFIQRKPITTAMAQPVPSTTSSTSNGTSNGYSTVDDGRPADEESLKGHFGWESFNGGKIHIPYIIRQTEKYCAVRIVEQKLLNKYLNVLHQDLYNCTSVRSYYITDVEARLLDEINFRHCDQCFGKEKFSMKDLIVRLSDAQKFQQFLEVCYKKLTNFSTPNDKCGFIRINSESVVPYTVRDGQKMVPLFYFEGETDNLKLKADSLSGWDLSYLKFCCKVQGIRNELFASETVSVISLDDIKSYFPQGTQFEDYWPNKVVDTQLLVGGQKSHNNTINWTHPPPKQITNTVQRSQQLQQQQKQQQQQQQQQRAMTGGSVGGLQHMYSNNVDMNYLRTMQQSGMSNQQALTSGWSSQITQSQYDQMLRLSAQTKQNSSSRPYTSRQQQQQIHSLLQSQLYPYSNAASMSLNSNGSSRTGTQQPPPLVRSQQQQSQMSNCGVSGSAPQLRSSTNPPPSTSQSTATYPYIASNNVNSSNNNSKSNSNVVTITRCPTNTSTSTQSQNSSYLNRIPASTTITPTQYYNSKDNSLPSSLSIYPKNSQTGHARSIIQSSVSPVIASPTRASPQAGYAKQPSISPASSMHILPAVMQQQLDELLLKQNFTGIANPEFLKETLLTYNSIYAKARQQQNAAAIAAAAAAVGAGNQSLSSSNQSSFPVRNKSVITTSRASAMDVIDLSASNSPTPSRSIQAAAALQFQQAQASVANKRAQNGQYLNGGSQSSSRSMQSSSSSSSSSSTARLQQQIQMQNPLAGINGYGTTAYKIEKSFIENQMVHCINMIPYSPNSDMIIPLSELRDQFYPNANLDVCKRVMQALEINLFSGTKPQYQAYSELGKTIADNIPFVRVLDVITYMPQINYMVRGQMQEAKNASKRARIS
ncbi:CLUMA_CG003769, isoform B [Clunio marinus]|uniref:CLUMA_CG003769, isoform B n=1 Tax=Clunio marinus TaxID=568069 RepID=A0A1J1HPT4_9DIPT|nr:CLUMA_CG003769, isoform B [Clunio marinus]